MTRFFNKLPILGLALFTGLGTVHAQHDQFVEIKFTPAGSSEKEVQKFVGEDAETFDLTAYINENIDNGDILISGRLSNDITYTRITFDSRKFADNKASFCQTVRSEVKPFLGVATSGMEDFSGVLLERIIDNSSAAKAEFQAGDVISYIDDREIRSVCDLKSTINKLEVGQQVEVTYNEGADNIKTFLNVGSRDFKYITWKSCEPAAVAEAEVEVIQNEVKPASADLAYELFPNPSTGVSTLTFEHDSRGELSIEIFDLQGKRIFMQDKIDFDHYLKKDINVANQPSGIYLVELTLNGESFTKELVVQRF